MDFNVPSNPNHSMISSSPAVLPKARVGFPLGTVSCFSPDPTAMGTGRSRADPVPWWPRAPPDLTLL